MSTFTLLQSKLGTLATKKLSFDSGLNGSKLPHFLFTDIGK